VAIIVHQSYGNAARGVDPDHRPGRRDGRRGGAGLQVDRSAHVFGDSYSDGGNGYALTGTPRSAPYDSRYSNGMTAVEHMARLFGLSLRHSEASGLATDASLNFAVSGAWTSSRNDDRAMDGKTGLLSQVAEFERRAKDRTLQFSPDTTLFFVAIGINDVLFGNLGGIDNATLVAGALENVEKAAHALNATGARHIALAMLPMVGLTPRGASLPAATGKAVKDAVVALNEGYQRMAGRLRAELKADVFTLPWGQYYDELMHNPAAFGLMNVGSCIRSTRPHPDPPPQAGEGREGAVCPDPQRFVFLDALHPTTVAHRVVGYRLATASWPHFVCAAPAQAAASGAPPTCRFLSAADGTFVGLDQSDPAPAGMACTQLAFRQYADMCNNCTAPPWSGEVKRASGEEWIASYVDGHHRAGSARWQLTSQTSSALVFHDDGRNLDTRFDLAARKGLQRRGTEGSWSATSDILSTDCR
jgi:phospholipase/lecithinase/hemolysin